MNLKNSYIEHKDWAKYANCSDNVIFIDFDTWISLFNPENDSWFFEKKTKYWGSCDYTTLVEYYLVSYTLKSRVTKRICFKTYKDYKQFHKFIEHYEKVKIYNEQKENLDKFINAVRKEEQRELEW